MITMVSRHLDSFRTSIRARAPFAAAAWLAWSVVLLGSRVDWTQYGISIALGVGGLVLSTAAMSDRGWASRGIVPGALLFLAGVALLRNSVGGISSGASALAIIPVFHTALYGRSRTELVMVLAGVGVFYLAPILIVGPPAYPHTQYRTALLSVTVSSIIGLATQQLVASVRRQASEASSRELMLEQLSEVVHTLFDSPNPRADVCAAAKRISGATAALFYEPVAGSAGLLCTATSESGLAVDLLSAGRGSAVQEAFGTGRAAVIAQHVESRVGNRALWVATGRPESGLYQPLVHDGATLGVLVVGWPDSLSSTGSPAAVVSLLAHEAAAVIARADMLDDLADAAQTDPLTGLPNRRAWDAQLKLALGDDRPLTIAMLDFDHFKQFNDTYGHPAGDRLLKETAAAWRDQLRSGDLLARLGGEEFGLLLPDCDADTAAEVTERLRRSMPQGRTCSAGIAIAQPGESAETTVARADRALYQAKSQGRNRSHLTAA
jgi:diguanylate cyclase (GGDEF)-like protein